MAKKVREQMVIFDKGLNTSLSDVGYSLHPVRMNNCWLSRDDRGGAVEVIPGYSTFHTFADNDVAIQSIGSAGAKKYSFALYGLGGTKFYRYAITDAPAGGDYSENIATKTGLTDGNKGSIFSYRDVDGTPHMWVFNGSDSPFMSEDHWSAYSGGAPYEITDIGVERPYTDDYAVGSATDRIYLVAGDADSGPGVQAFLSAPGGDLVDQTTAANNATVDDVDLGPSTGWSTADEDGHYVASDTRFGGIAYDDFTAQAANESKYTWEYWNGSIWQKFKGLDSELANMDTTELSPTVTWTVPSTSSWKKSTLTSGSGGSAVDHGPYYWARCRKTAGVIGAGGTTCSQVFILDREFGEDEAEGVLNYYISKIEDTAESALSSPLYQADGTQGIDAGVGGTIKVVIDKSDAGGVGADPNDADYYDNAEFKVYRTYEDGSQPYDTGLRITTSATGDGEVEDNIPDSELGNLPYLHGDTPTDNGLPALAHFGRVFFAETVDGSGYASNRVYWSDLANPESFWTEDNGSYAEVFPGDNDSITALARDRDGVIVFKQNHIYKLNGRTPDQFYVSEITLSDPTAGTIGTPSIRSMCYTPAGIVFYWNKGVYLYNGSYPRKISSAIDEDLRAIDSGDETEGVALGYYGNRNQVYVSVPLSSSTPDTTYIFDMDIGQWSGRLTEGFRQFLSLSIDPDLEPLVAAAVSDANEIFLGVDPAASGKVFQLDDGTDFDGSAINTNFRLSPFHGKSINKLKTFLYVDVIFEPVANGLFNLEWWINGESGDSTTVAVTMDKTGYDRHRRRVNIGYKGRSLDLKLKNNASYSGSWKIYGFVIGYIEHESFSL